MLKRTLVAALTFAAVSFGSLSGARARDDGWVEERKPSFQAIPAERAQADMPPVAPDIVPANTDSNQQQPPSHLAQGGFLTGSATATGMGAVVRPQPPRFAAIQGGALGLGADADTFILNTRRNETVPPQAMRAWLEKTHPEFNLSAQNPMQVIEVKGAWDNAGQIMDNMEIRHTRIKGRELRDTLTNNTRVVILNCEGKIPEDQYELIRQWVIRGGYLITTDWALRNFVERAFPGTIAFSGSNTRGEVVDAVVTARNSALLAGANIPRGTWKLDEESQEVRIVRPDVVQVLVRSNKLASQERHLQFVEPNQCGVLACTFAYGRGRVLHLVGHFDYNSGFGFNRYLLPDAIPGRGIGLRQAIATNFLLQGLERNR